MRKLSFLFTLLSCITFCFAQTPKGRLVIRANPPWAKISIDNDTSLASKSNVIMLDSGLHTVKIYGNKLETFETSFTVKRDTSITIFKSLKYKKEYIDYLNASKKYKLNKTMVTYGVPVVIVGLIGGGIVLNKVANNYYDDAVQGIIDYHNTIEPDEFKRAKENVRQSEKNYRLSKTLSYGCYGLAGAATYKYIRMLKKQSAKEAPVYKEGLSFEMNSLNYFSLSYKF
jgi:hypothetical protein